jgi:serine/threonine-protein kinase
MTAARLVCPSCQAQYDEVNTRYCGRCGSDMQHAPPPGPGAHDPMIGRVVEGRYRIHSALGRGAMGAVYKVEHLAMGKLAAMKVLHPTLAIDSEVGARFRREGEAVSRLSHPNTVQVFDFGVEKGLMYLVMELVKGEDLGQILRRDGPIKWARARNILLQVCESLAEAHDLGIIHRDLKPENLLISRSRDGRDFVKVLDFGLAKLRDTEEANQVTARGSVIGTPYYMSPEQIRAESLDARADVYSLGALLYRMVTGEHPYAASTPVAVLTKHLTDPLVLPSKRRPDLDIDAAVDVIVERAMCKDRDGRYASVDDLHRAVYQSPPITETSEPDALGGKRRESDRIDPTGRSPADSQLRREDIDAYERGLKRRRWVGMALLPVAAICAVVAFALLRVQKAQPLEVEREPNNSAKEANIIGSGQTVRGHIGRCLSPEESDRDFYRFSIGRGPHVLHVDLTGVPKLDLKLEVFDPAGQRVAVADDLGAGESETLPDVRLDGAGEYYISVREVWVAGKPATENDDDWYTLTASWQPLGPNQEAEPNDTPAQATSLAVEEPMRGYAGRANDVDYYYLRGEGGGTLSGSVSGIDGVDLRVVVLPAGSSAGPPLADGKSLPPGAKVFDAGGPGAPETFEGIAWAAGAPSPLVVIERKDGKADPSGRIHGLVGLDVPYSLNVRLSR